MTLPSLNTANGNISKFLVCNSRRYLVVVPQMPRLVMDIG